jgi:dienelactone hydrolase
MVANMRRLLFVFVVLVTVALLATACSDDEPAAGGDTATTTTTTTITTTTITTTTTTTTTEPPPSLTAADLAAVGPYPVGVTTRELSNGNLVEVWYPAGADAEGQTDTYMVRNFAPDVMKELIPEETNDRVTVDAGREATVATDGPYPLVLFSHGSTSFRFQSTNLAHHLASWGMVVASADHPTRALVNFLGGSEHPQTSVDDVLEMLDLVTSDHVLGAAVDADRVGLSGHSAGGGTALAAAATGDFAGYVSFASGAFDEGDLPDMPSMWMAGELDEIIDPQRTLDAWQRAPSPKYFLQFEASGHLAFSDLCAVGDGSATLIGLADAAGLGPLLNDRIRRLGTDGCEEPNRPVTEVWPGIHQATTGFFRFVFGESDSALGTDAPAVAGVEAMAG